MGQVFSPSHGRILPWVLLLQGSPAAGLAGISPGLLSRASRTRWTSHLIPRRPRVSITNHLASSYHRTEARRFDETTLLEFVHRLDPEAFERSLFRAMGSPHPAPCITADCPGFLRRDPSLYRSCQDRLRCQAFATRVYTEQPPTPLGRTSTKSIRSF
jgi:hypothetical protein